VARSAPGAGQTRFAPAALRPLVPAALEGATLVCREPLSETSVVTVGHGKLTTEWHGLPIPPLLAAELNGIGFASAPFQLEHLTGRVFFAGLTSITLDLMPLLELVAREVGSSLEQLYLQECMRELTVREQRVQLARELHDGSSRR
jgi:signal transduction histidine kinase